MLHNNQRPQFERNKTQNLFFENECIRKELPPKNVPQLRNIFELHDQLEGISPDEFDYSRKSRKDLGTICEQRGIPSKADNKLTLLTTKSKT